MKAQKPRNDRKQRIVKIGGGSLLLASLSLVTVGFSTWLVVSQIVETQNIEVDAANVTTTSLGIFTGLKFTTVKLCQDGAINSETIVSTIQISAIMTVNREPCVTYNYLDSSSNLRMKATLGCDDSSFLALITGFQRNISGVTIYSAPAEYTTEYSRELSLPLASDQTSLTLTYTFEDSNFFKSYYSSYSNVQYLKFSVEAIAQ